ncbi:MULTISPECIES: hypothetical protein [Flavobacteriaceae]|jgi:hypothetical protein|uniref:NlpE-like protein n=1 Tax=Meridianimaribacter flavus TaxID=571115 RepID=A0ABY2G7J1_9FLAO|nr:hypothetical protein [Meridianimaribacter flavus]TDY13426.1 NlpE-like protein [Meridianimaribacter flavus]
MKKIFLALLVSAVLFSCKNDSKNDTSSTETTTENVDGKTAKQNDGLTLVVGEFVYYADAAVIQTKNTVYGVVIDKKMHELNDMAQQYKKEATDYVTVEVRGKIIPKPQNEEGWDYRVEIKEILKVSASKADENNVIKLGTK